MSARTLHFSVSAVLQVYFSDACDGRFDTSTDDGAATYSAWLPACRES